MSLKNDPKYKIDGDQIVNRASGKPIPDDEPVMIFRAKDKRAREAIAYYSYLCRDEAHAENAHLRWRDFDDFATAHPDRMKEPDDTSRVADCDHPNHDNPGLIVPCPECGSEPGIRQGGT